MFLKTLTLKGFKSFAEATVLDMEPGVTVVVGPNGSGKSNVVDAIGWVLGAQAPSSVRSQKMDDVIFAGTAARPALGRAEVALCIDNSSGMLPIEFSEVTLTRTLFRSGDSEYAINGVPCRLLDIQELLSDSGVGRQQHVIISQGQIDAVLNARPEERRLIIEEAAGVLKYRRRKEKAERRLAATEASFTRLQDLLREVRRGLRPLERQADAARRHGAVVAELQALRVYVAGQELQRLRARLERGTADRRLLEAEERERRSALAALDRAVLDAEARLSAMGADDLGDSLARFGPLREKAAGLASLLAERLRGIERERAASVDQAVVATLEAEAARLGAELREVDDQLTALGPELEQLAGAEAALAEARAAFDARWAGTPAQADARAAEVRGELAAHRAGAERSAAELGRAESRLRTLAERETALAGEVASASAAARAAEDAGAALQQRAGAAAAEADAAEVALSAALDASRSAEADARAWQARAEALAQALAQARARAGEERLTEVAGVVGTLLDVVAVDDGWEPAFEAAAGEAIAAVVVEGERAARDAIAALARGGAGGAVLALAAGAAAPTAVRSGGLREHVRPAPGVREPQAVAQLLDALVGGVAVAATWEEALDVVVARPAAVAVTRDGDRFGPTGWRLGAAGGAGATGAALDEARQRAERLADTARRARSVAEQAADTARVARRAVVDAARERERNASALSTARATVERLDAQRREGAEESEALRAHLAELASQEQHDTARLAHLEELLPELEALDERAGAVIVLRRDLDGRRNSLEQRRGFLVGRRDEIDTRLAASVDARREAEANRVQLERRHQVTERLAAHVAGCRAGIERDLADLQARRKRQSDAAREVSGQLNEARRERAKLTEELEAQRERLRRAELGEAETRLRLEQATEAVRHDLETEPDAAIAAPPPELPEGTRPTERVHVLERELRLMGPINPLALQEFEELQERHRFLEGQLDDVKTSRRELHKVIRAVDGEIVNVFSAAYADVEANFRSLFETLFPGGQGRLRLTEPENLLETGIEVEARPSGKNVRKLSLLSGGERSLTALAFLFAVFRARPSPFYVMDEVEAALDDVNLHRFLDLLQEFRSEAQLIVVSHQKRTMEAADCLYGVTMKPGGSSRVVSEKVTTVG